MNGSQALIEQAEAEAEPMLDFLGDPHGGLAVSDRLVEPAKLGEYVDEITAGGYRLDGRSSEPRVEPR